MSSNPKSNEYSTQSSRRSHRHFRNVRDAEKTGKYPTTTELQTGSRIGVAPSTLSCNSAQMSDDEVRHWQPYLADGQKWHHSTKTSTHKRHSNEHQQFSVTGARKRLFSRLQIRTNKHAIVTPKKQKQWPKLPYYPTTQNINGCKLLQCAPLNNRFASYFSLTKQYYTQIKALKTDFKTNISRQKELEK